MGVVHDFIFEMFIWLAPLFRKQVTESWCFQLSILPTFNIVNAQKWCDPMDGPGVPWSAGRDLILSPTLKVCSLRFNMVQQDLGFILGLGINGESNPKKVVTFWLADLWKPHLFMGVAAAILFNQRGGMVLQITNRQRRFRIREKNLVAFEGWQLAIFWSPIHVASRIRHVSRTFPASIFSKVLVSLQTLKCNLWCKEQLRNKSDGRWCPISRKGSVQVSKVGNFILGRLGQRRSLNTKSDFLTCFI